MAEYAQFPPEVVRLAKRKAAELESSTGSGDSGGDSKRNKAGDGVAVRKALADFAALPLRDMDPQQAASHTRQVFAHLMTV